MAETTTAIFPVPATGITHDAVAVLQTNGSSRDTSRIIADLKEALEFVQQRVVNREEVIEQIFLALLIGEHILIESRTGVGKTLLAEQVFRMFEGARTFKVQASKEQQPDT